MVVHNDGHTTEDKDANVIKRVSHVHLQDSEIVLEEGFLGYALTSFEEFFKVVHESVKAQNGKPSHYPLISKPLSSSVPA